MAERDFRAGRRYATALFSLANKEGKLDLIENDLKNVARLMVEAPSLRELWESRVVPAGRKRALVDQTLASSVDELTLSFLRLLVDKRRESILDTVQVELLRLSDIARHLVRAEATFAIEPTPEETAGLTRSLEQRTGEQINLTVHIDPSILGGVVVRMRDNIIDGSVRGTLEGLREQLLQEA